jgi:predicted ATPase
MLHDFHADAWQVGSSAVQAQQHLHATPGFLGGFLGGFRGQSVLELAKAHAVGIHDARAQAAQELEGEWYSCFAIRS